MIDRTVQWFEERTSLLRWLRERAVAPVYEGGWRAAIGVAIGFLFLLQILTGFIISFYYVPSSPHAHTSVLYIIKEVPGGALLRALHHYIANGLIVLSLIFLLQLFYQAAYKNRRELFWITSVIFFGLVMAACFTGQLLPWDQKGYYGMRVGASIVADLPLIGNMMRRLFIGDIEISTLTLSRFFALHIIAIPIIMAIVLVVRATVPNRAPSSSIDAKDAKSFETYYPNQFAREIITSAVVFLAILLISWRFGSPLEPVANPADTNYIARPEWFFLPLFQLLKLFPANTEGIGGMLATGLLFLLLLIIPFVDRSDSRALMARKMATGILAGLGAGIIALIVMAVQADRVPAVREQLARQHEQAQELISSPFRPVALGRATQAPVGQSSVTSVSDQPQIVRTFIGLCAPCHGPQAVGGSLGPSLIGLAAKKHYSEQEIAQILAQPTSHGLSEAMPAFGQLSAGQRGEMAAFLFKLESPQQLATAAKDLKPPPYLFVQNCSGCHGPQGEGGFGPRLNGVGERRSRDALVKLMANPTGAGLNNIMPPFEELTETQRGEIADWLITLK